MKLHEVIRIALEAGELLMRNGAETYRVEESMIKICNCYGHSCETFVLPTGIFLTVHSPVQDSETFIRRINGRTLNLDKIDRINSFSRSLAKHPLSYNEALRELKAIKVSKDYSVQIQMIAAACMAFIFTFLFGGRTMDGLIAAAIGTIAYVINLRMKKSGYFPYLIFFAIGIISGFLVFLSEYLIPGINTYIIIISSVLLYLPGVAMTNGVRDLLGGDPVSGLTRLGEAILTVAAIGMGVGLAISISYFFF